jgi:transposase-like protein
MHLSHPEKFFQQLTGCKDKRKLLNDASRIYQVKSEEEFYRRAQAFKIKWDKYRHHSALKYMFKMMPHSIKYFEIPKEILERS